MVSLNHPSQVLICSSLRAIGTLLGHPCEANKKSRSIISKLNVLPRPAASLEDVSRSADEEVENHQLWQYHSSSLICKDLSAQDFPD